MVYGALCPLPPIFPRLTPSPPFEHLTFLTILGMVARTENGYNDLSMWPIFLLGTEGF